MPNIYRMPAKHPGKCYLCGDRIDVGQDISPWEKTWSHYECVQGRLTPLPDPKTVTPPPLMALVVEAGLDWPWG